ncbi:MAG: nucleotidyltransferase domain-containing protein [Candidatus Aenigmatarchaeota archaeon]
MDENLKKIKEIIVQTAKEMNIEIDRIILFGSRARGDYREDSDYDLLIVTKNKLNEIQKRNFVILVHKTLVKNFQEGFDIIVVDKQYFEKYRDVYGCIVGIANLEGIII